MHIGKRIRYLRMKNNLSQEKLAKGIISVSHLSNLESGRYSASEETIQFLAKRLKVKASYLLDCFTANDKLEEVLAQLFFTIISEVDDTSQILESIDLPIKCIYQEWTYYYLQGSYYYKINELNHARHIEKNILPYFISTPDEIRTEFPESLKQAYYYFKGISSYRNNQLEASYTFFNELVEYIRHLPTVYADMHYNLALISYQLADYFKAKKHADSANEHFINNGDLESVATIHNLLGTIYCDTFMYNDALQELNKAMNISKTLKFHRLQARILHNRGLVHKGLGNHSKALDQFKKSYRLKTSMNSEFILVTIIEIIKCHLALEQYTEAKRLARSSSQYMKTKKDYHLLTSLSGNIALQEGNQSDFIKKKKDALHYFTSNNFLKYAKGIAKELGDYYFKNKKYKNASIYYKMELNNLYEEKGGEKK